MFMAEVILQRRDLVTVLQFVPQTQHVISLIITVNKPSSAVLRPVRLAAVLSLAMTGCSEAVTYVRYITTTAISRLI